MIKLYINNHYEFISNEYEFLNLVEEYMGEDSKNYVQDLLDQIDELKELNYEYEEELGKEVE